MITLGRIASHSQGLYVASCCFIKFEPWSLIVSYHTFIDLLTSFSSNTGVVGLDTRYKRVWRQSKDQNKYKISMWRALARASFLTRHRSHRTAVTSRYSSDHAGSGVPYETLQSSDKSPPPASVPESADVVVIGGGSIGCSTLYHLAKMGVTNAVLVERDQLTSGTTWHTGGTKCE